MFQITNGPKILVADETKIREGKEQPQNHEARGRTVRYVLLIKTLRTSQLAKEQGSACAPLCCRVARELGVADPRISSGGP